MKEIKNYIHHYLGCQAQWSDARNPEEPTVMGELIEIGNHTACIEPEDCEYHECAPFEVKPVLRPIKSMTEEDFYSFFPNIEGEILLKATINNHWCAAYYDSIEYMERVEEELPIVPSELIMMLEEDDFESVWSLSTRDKSIAYGTSDEMRFFLGIKETAEWISHLMKRELDLFGLIDAGLAIDATTLKQP